MITKYLENISKIYDHVDSIIIINREGIVEYSVINNKEINSFVIDNYVGKHVFDVYPSLTEETSNHFRVLKTGKPILNETQELTDMNGREYTFVNSTFPIESDGAIIGTIEASVVISIKDKKRANQSKDGNEHLYSPEDIITKDGEMLKIKGRIPRIANSKSPVMIYGETGTGKELIAQSIHSSSTRGNKPFVSVNCSAIPSTIFESIVFGSEKGSFTGAEQKKGLIKQADRGTLFLDEINSLEISLQAKLLKVIEDNQVRPIGSENVETVDVRYLAAMNILPSEAVEQGIIRSDLFYRLNVIQINIPPLAKRKSDIDLLVDYFVDMFNAQNQKSEMKLSTIVRSTLIAYHWPGNVRELKNTIEYCFHIAENNLITLSDLPDYILNDDYQTVDALHEGKGNQTLKFKVEAYEKEIITNTLKHSKNVTAAAKSLGLTRQALQYKIEKLNIQQ